MPDSHVIRLATRGSPLALAQTDLVLARCRAACPGLTFERCIIRTTGDKLQRASMAQAPVTLPKGLFTKELETALLDGEADLAVHSLKDLPTDLPTGLTLGAVLEREDPRDVLVSRAAGTAGPCGALDGAALVANLPPGATVATSSTRRKEQLLALRSDLHIVEIRGNVGTRLQKLADNSALSATLLAAAGLRRLGYRVRPDGGIDGPEGQGTPPGLVAALLPIEVMLPCVGQAAIGLEIRAGDTRLESVCLGLNHAPTLTCVRAERAFLHAMGGGCQSPVAAYARLAGDTLEIQGVSFRAGPAVRAAVTGRATEPEAAGVRLARALLPSGSHLNI